MSENVLRPDGVYPQRPVDTERRHFSGKRDGERSFKFLDVEVVGAYRNFDAMAVDVSPSGVLIRILDPEFASEEESKRLDYYAAIAYHHFEDGLTVHFGSGMVSAEGDIVRVTEPYSGSRGLVLLGVRFRRKLNNEECRELGIDPLSEHDLSG